MAKEVVWTVAAVKDRLSIYQFWSTHNQSAVYSEKLETLFEKGTKLIGAFPNVGTKTNIEGVRVKVVRSFKIFYADLPDRILIIRVWDSRQDPKKLKF